MTSIPRLHDGRFLDARDFQFFDEHRRITRSEKYGIALAWGICEKAPVHSVVIVKADGIYAEALGAPSASEAAEELCTQLNTLWQPRRFEKNLVAVVNFPLTWLSASILARTGADAIFAPTGSDAAELEMNLKFSWFGEAMRHRGGYEKHALILPRYHALDALAQKRAAR